MKIMQKLLLETGCDWAETCNMSMVPIMLLNIFKGAILVSDNSTMYDFVGKTEMAAIITLNYNNLLNKT